jgi:hypothetical protein
MSPGPGFRRSQVVDNLTGQFVADPIRKSDVAPFPLAAERPLLHAINRRAARASGTDVSHGEPLRSCGTALGRNIASITTQSRMPTISAASRF